MTQQTSDDTRDSGEDDLPVVPLDDQEREDDLESETPDDRPPFDGTSVRGERVGKADKCDETE